MLDGTLFIVKCARYGNPDKNLYQDFFSTTSYSDKTYGLLANTRTPVFDEEILAISKENPLICICIRDVKSQIQVDDNGKTIFG